MNRKSLRNLVYICLAIFLLCAALPAQAKVSDKEANRLKTDLTPFGAIRTGNAEGTIPAWTGGMTKTPEGVTYDIALRGDTPGSVCQ